MGKIRKIEIRNFRGIKNLAWCPSPGVNCLIGPGDSGKSSILDAVDFCLGARRNIQFTDADFYGLDVETPIQITVTLGELNDAIKSLETYGMYVRGFDKTTGSVDDEPEKSCETVLCLRLTVASDLEPNWTLFSDRAAAQDQTRNLNWSDRGRLAPTRIGATADYHLGWRRGSVLNSVSEERADASAALAKAARHARAAFGADAQDQLGGTLKIVSETAKDLGIPIGDQIKALLDAHSVSFTGGTISLHNADGVPLRNLGMGSIRLLIAGLQRKASAEANLILIDELEHGLEPHRIVRFLGSLGAKEIPEPLQVLATTHSPVALCELSGGQIFVVRPSDNCHHVMSVGSQDGIQGVIRLYPYAFLARSVIICEGASEVGLVRGIDLHRINSGLNAITAEGVALVDCGGGDSDRPFQRANAFRSLGYRAAVIRDDDKSPTPRVEEEFIENGGMVTKWRPGRALEDELFLSLSSDGVRKLLDRAMELHGDNLVNDHIKSVSKNAVDLNSIQAELGAGNISTPSRKTLGIAARTKKASWFKTVTLMEDIAREIVGPDLPNADPPFRKLIENIFTWASDAR